MAVKRGVRFFCLGLHYGERAYNCSFLFGRGKRIREHTSCIDDDNKIALGRSPFATNPYNEIILDEAFNVARETTEQGSLNQKLRDKDLRISIHHEKEAEVKY
jgi:hypothetical protein